jgi:hypothetical protein
MHKLGASAVCAAALAAVLPAAPAAAAPRLEKVAVLDQPAGVGAPSGER